MHFEGIFKAYLEAVATNSTGLVASVSSIQKGAQPQPAVQLGPVSSLFSVHATGPLNTTFSAQGLVFVQTSFRLVYSCLQKNWHLPYSESKQ